MFKTIKRLSCIPLLIIAGVAQADVCIYLNQNLIGKNGDVTVFKITAKAQTATQGETLTSIPVKYGDSYYFDFKDVRGMTAFTVNSLTVTKNGRTQLTCTNPYIFPVANAAVISLSQDTMDPGQCLLSTTTVQSISPCHK